VGSPTRAPRRASPSPAEGPRAGGPQARTPMYAIVEVSGKQFKVQKDAKLYVPRQQAEVGDTLTLDRVLLVSGDEVQVGQPALDGVSVTAKVLGHMKGDKVIVFKKKRRKGYRVKNGHRQPYTQIAIEALNL
jgi:large subunit ribosomal protein L21